MIPEYDHAPYLSPAKDGVILKIYLAPRASSSRVVGIHGDNLKIAITAPAVEGAANQALIKFLSKKLGVPKSSIQILSGEHNRHKLVLVHGADLKVVTAALA